MFRKYWIKYRKLCVISILCVICEAVCDLMQPRIMSSLIDDGVQKLDLAFVLRSAGLMLAVTALGACFACSRNILSSRASHSFAADLRLDMFVKIQSLSVADSESYDGGSLITRMTNDVTQLTNFVNGLMRIFFKAPVVCAGSVFLAASINKRAAPIVLGIVLIAFTAIGLSMKLSYPQFARAQAAMDRLNTTVREYLLGIRLVKAFGRQDSERERFESANGELTAVTRKATRTLGLFSPVTNLAANSGIALIVILGARWVGRGDMQVGQVVAFVSYMTQILFSLSVISNILNTFVRTKASHLRVRELMAMPDTEPFQDMEGVVGIPENAPVVEFEDLSFRYPQSTGESALENVSFTLERGRTLGVIGPTGSGKSTLAALLLRFYEPCGGTLRFQGVDIRSWPVRQLRSRIAAAPQTPTLFSGTIAENIRWGNAGATRGEIQAAADSAQAGEFISERESGFDTVLGQAGQGLSGGQKQRLSIARALVRKAELLILDDCTSALDALTDARVRAELSTLGMSCIMISQRVGAVMRADKILVLESGRVAGLGTHSELLETCPAYRDIVIAQLGREAV